jgi:hypothetical protein
VEPLVVRSDRQAAGSVRFGCFECEEAVDARANGMSHKFATMTCRAWPTLLQAPAIASIIITVLVIHTDVENFVLALLDRRTVDTATPCG